MSNRASSLVWAPKEEAVETSNLVCCGDEKAGRGLDTPPTGYSFRNQGHSCCSHLVEVTGAEGEDQMGEGISNEGVLEVLVFRGGLDHQPSLLRWTRGKGGSPLETAVKGNLPTRRIHLLSPLSNREANCACIFTICYRNKLICERKQRTYHVWVKRRAEKEVYSHPCEELGHPPLHPPSPRKPEREAK